MAVWGLISDVHGNLPALRRAVELCRSEGAERFAFLGDLLGRGDSDGCAALVRPLADVSVVGNRDLDWRDRVGADARAYVLGLPVVAETDDFLAAHGDGRLDRDLCTDDARRGFARTYRRLAASGVRLGLLGHSHRARVWRLLGLGAAPELLYDAADDPAPRTLQLDVADPAIRYVVNVGTTGLPFAGKGPPSCAIYDARLTTIAVLRLDPGPEV